MSRSTFLIITTAMLVILAISLSFPYQRFNIAIEHATIIRVAIGVVVLGMGVTGFFE
jgi:hypothetical protein